MRETGIYQRLGNLNYFIPHPLPPTNPPFELTPEIASLYGQASFALGELNELGSRLPDQKRFIKAYVIKEALLSSAIEGIHTTLLDVFTYPIKETKRSKETQLVLNYTEALSTALRMMHVDGLPLVSRVWLAAHKVLMSSGEEEHANPGFYRQQSVQVGDLVPPPAQKIPELMTQLETYINEHVSLPPLIKAGLVHVQFETIHPFLDGNGRIGRLLIVLMLIDSGLLKIPILYPSYYFKKHHMNYYQNLDRVRTEGNFESWITFYLTALRDSALDATRRAKEIEDLEDNIKHTIQHDALFRRIRETALSMLNLFFQAPIFGISEMSNNLGKTYNTTHNLLKKFIGLGIVSEYTEQRRNKTYHFEPYIQLLEKEY